MLQVGRNPGQPDTTDLPLGHFYSKLVVTRFTHFLIFSACWQFTSNSSEPFRRVLVSACSIFLSRGEILFLLRGILFTWNIFFNSLVSDTFRQRQRLPFLAATPASNVMFTLKGKGYGLPCTLFFSPALPWWGSRTTIDTYGLWSHGIQWIKLQRLIYILIYSQSWRLVPKFENLQLMQQCIGKVALCRVKLLRFYTVSWPTRIFQLYCLQFCRRTTKRKCTVVKNETIPTFVPRQKLLHNWKSFLAGCSTEVPWLAVCI